MKTSNIVLALLGLTIPSNSKQVDYPEISEFADYLFDIMEFDIPELGTVANHT